MNTTAAPAADDAQRRPADNSAAAIVHASTLPAPLADLVLAVTAACRLWNTERAEVARELCAHFLDGIDAGASPADLASTFGDPRRAARLITAARKRLRPLWWRTSRAALRAAAWFLLACAVTYALLCARFFLVSPNVTRNIAGELNAQVTRSPVAERAWPLYIQAKKEFGAIPEFMSDADGGDPSGPGEKNWDLMVAWLDAHAPALATLREAAARPVLGCTYSAGMDPDYGKALEVSNPTYTFDPSVEPQSENPLVVGILLPHLGEMRRDARWLRSDAALAASRKDSARFLADIEALLGIATHAMQEQFQISKRVGIVIADLAVDTVLKHAASPGLLSRADLRALAHSIAAFGGGGRIPIDLSPELLFIDDILQRFFSDNGRGDGHFIGGPAMDRLYDDFGVARPRGFPLLKAVQPIQSAIMPSRAQIMDKARLFVAAAAVDDSLSPWRHDQRTSDRAYADLMNSGIATAVPFLASLVSIDGHPATSVFASRDLFLARRDAALALLAAASSRLATGQWPAALSDVVPSYLPALPIDPFDGQPLRYLPPTPGRDLPLIYSVGADQADNGAAAPATERGRSAVHDLYLLKKFRAALPLSPDELEQLDTARGDWILWPPLPRAGPTS
ncbi:MAG: hypothetical protein KF745_09185 [Phycisphaeraceae bacterium]|nr:hypothetical protein [Phycisphaeraceae bacterium]